MNLKGLIRTIPDHPKPGIQFRDITTLLLDPKGLEVAVDGLAEPYLDPDRAGRPEIVVGIEARGFIFGTALAYRLGLGFLPLRKPGKLPGETIDRDFDLEYGTDRIEMHVDALRKGQRVLLVDDLIATGGLLRPQCTSCEPLVLKLWRPRSLLRYPTLEASKDLRSSIVRFAPCVNLRATNT
jgi:adenine phosphoribosyltransferase